MRVCAALAIVWFLCVADGCVRQPDRMSGLETRAARESLGEVRRTDHAAQMADGRRELRCLWKINLAPGGFPLSPPATIGDGSAIVGYFRGVVSTAPGIIPSPDAPVGIDVPPGELFRVSPTGTVADSTYIGGLRCRPVIAADGTIYAATYSRGLWAVEPDTHGLRVRWQQPIDGFISTSPALNAAGDVHVCTMDGLVTVFSSDGRVQVRSVCQGARAKRSRRGSQRSGGSCDGG